MAPFSEILPVPLNSKLNIAVIVFHVIPTIVPQESLRTNLQVIMSLDF